MKRVLVTGANGQLGRCIKDISSLYSNLEFTFKDSKQFDITKANLAGNIFELNNFDYCINCAAYTNVEQAEKVPELSFKVNAEGLKNLATACKKTNIVLIHISTDYVFDGEKNEPYTIYDLPNPINEYGKSKLKGEEYVQNILKQFYIIRASWLYSKYGNNFYNFVLNKAKDHDYLYITEEQKGCPTNANNLARFLIEIIVKNMPFGLYHFTDGEEMTWLDFAKKIVNNEGLKIKLISKHYQSKAKRPKYSVLKQ